MKKKLIIGIIILVIILAIGMLLMKQEAKTGLKSLTYNNKTILIKENIFEYDLYTKYFAKKDDLKFEFYDLDSKYEILNPVDQYFIGNKILIKVLESDREIEYTFNIIDDLTDEYLKRRVTGCVSIVSDTCLFEGGKILFKDHKFNFIVNNKKAIALEAKNYSIINLTSFDSKIAFIYKNIANDDDKTLYIINENGDTIFNKKNLNDDYHTVIKENIKIKKNKLIVTTSRIVNGFDVLVNGHFKPVCDLEYDEPINFTYEIDHLKNDAIKISEQNLNNYLKELKNEGSKDFCSPLGYK